MSDYFDLLERELRDAVPRAAAAGAPAAARPPAPGARRRLGPRPGVVPAAIGIAATLLVVGLALVMLGHRDKTAPSVQPASRAPATPRSTVTSRSVPPWPARDMLSGRGIAGVRFGQPRATAIAGLHAVLGWRGSHPRSYRGDCGLDSSITWSSSGQAPLTVYFAQGRLVGYEYGEPGRLVARPPAHGPVLATTRGLTIGDTLERGRRLYGGAFTVSAAQGGTWTVSTTGGRIDGYASGVPQPGNLNALRVVTIDAGNVGCPAVSP